MRIWSLFLRHCAHWLFPVAAESGPSEPAEPPARTILITGAAGQIATAIRPMLSVLFERIILVDTEAPAELLSNEHFIRADLCDASAIQLACSDADAILHLAGAPSEAAYEGIRGPNLDGAVNLFEAARHAGISRVVFASTLHTHGFYPRDQWFNEASPPRPDSIYAASKMFGEALAQVYARKYGMRVACLRIGAFSESPLECEPGNWIGPADLAQLCQIALTHPDIGFEVFHALADYRGSPLGPSRAARFGFVPTVSTESYDDALERARYYWKDGNAATRFRGSTFTLDIEQPES